MALTRDALKKHDAAQAETPLEARVGSLDTLKWRQFGCEACKQQWWRKVTVTKPVSHCPKCKAPYVPVKPEEGLSEGKM